ncbi:MAG: protein-export chaperone SecB [Candidatus Polarisedimenticolia bacterium]|nr:protein-export chaperone SecB [bacterium]
MERDGSGTMREMKCRILAPPELLALKFRRDESSPLPENGQMSPELSFELLVSRFAREDIGVTLELALRGVPGVDASTTFRVAFRVPTGLAEDDLARDLRLMAAHTAPAMLYPFMRETLAGAFLKAGLPPFLAPVIDFRAMFDPSDVPIPDAPPQSSEPK